MITIEVASSTLHDLREAIVLLERARTKLLNRSNVHEEARDYMAKRWDENFQGEGSIYSSWSQLEPSWTVIERGSAHPILVRDASLWAHFAEQNEDATITTDTTEWSFQNEEGAWTVSHHEGYPNPIRGRRRIPARVLWDFNNEDEQHIEELFSVWLDSVFIGV